MLKVRPSLFASSFGFHAGERIQIDQVKLKRRIKIFDSTAFNFEKNYFCKIQFRKINVICFSPLQIILC